MSKEELQDLHKKLSKAKYFYYEKSESIMTDYEFDKLEKDYDKYCEIYNAPIERRLSSFVGFSHNIPRQLFENFPQERIKTAEKIRKSNK